MLWCASGVLGLAGAQGVGAFGGGSAPDRMAGPPERSVAEWLVRLQQASRIPSYVGTFVVSSSSGAMSSARIEVNQTYALKDAAQAHRDLEARKTTGSTILLP